jgi:AcrR family transcriptional regulator
MTETLRSQQKADRRLQVLRASGRMFADRGFHAVSIEELGAAVGMTGPALYRHFPSKEAILAAVLQGISERLLAGGRAEVAYADSPQRALDQLIAFHTTFAMSEPELIRVQDRDLTSLSSTAARSVRRTQRAYVEVWVEVLQLLAPQSDAVARTKVQAVFGLLNSTPFSARNADAASTSRVLQAMARAALLAPLDAV